MLKFMQVPDVSAGEVAPVLVALRAGIDPGKLTRELAVMHTGNPACAARLVDFALACLWLAEGAPIGDVLTMLECRHRFEFTSAACRAYAIEILRAAEHEIELSVRGLTLTPKEPEYAVA